MERLRKKNLEEVGTNAYIVGKIVKSRLKWAGHMVSDICRPHSYKNGKREEEQSRTGYYNYLYI